MKNSIDKEDLKKKVNEAVDKAVEQYGPALSALGKDEWTDKVEEKAECKCPEEICTCGKRLAHSTPDENTWWEEEWDKNNERCSIVWDNRLEENIKSFIRQTLSAQREQICKEIESKIQERILNEDNPQYVLGWNACRYLILNSINNSEK